MTDHTAARALHVVAPESLHTWFRYFVDDPGGLDRIQHAGSNLRLPVVDLRRRLAAVNATVVVFHSSHETLLRDCMLAAQLRAAGFATYAQSPKAAWLGVDKFRMRRFLAEHGLSALRWWRAGDPYGSEGADPMVVVKARSGTQSVGIRLTRLRAASMSADEFCEVYADGTEYSVLVYRDDAGDAVLPPVWKGSTSPELVPPWRRLRLCPDPFGGSALDDELRERGWRTAVAACVRGWVEVELLVTADGAVHVLEINPRVSGTVRIAALATGIRTFSLHRDPAARGRLEPVRRAAEVPYAGPAVADPLRATFGTSRLTVAADTYRQVAEMLRPAADAGAQAVLVPLAARERSRRSVSTSGSSR